MDRVIGRPSRDLWLPALIGLVGVLASLAIWGVLVTERREQLRRSTEETAIATASAIEVGLAHHLAILEGLADLRRRFAAGAEAEWRATLAERLDRASGLVAVDWITGDRSGGEVADPPGGGPGHRPRATDDADARDGPRFEGPIEGEAGRIGYRVVLPVEVSSSHPAGRLIGRFEAAPFFETVLRARASGYALEVLAAGRRLYARGEPTNDAWQDWWQSERTVLSPFGGPWRIVLRPTPEYAAARLSPIPHYLLAAGVVLSLVLAVLAHQLRVIKRQSRVLAESHRLVEQRGAELERRVAERTEALEEVVAELEAFNHSVSHDLRSPLGAILNFVAILEEDFEGRVLDEEGMAIVARIERSASRATTLLEDLLKLSRAGRAALRFERVDMNALVAESFAQVRAAQNDDDVELVVGPLPAAHGDAALLGAVLGNLVGNAIKYSRGCEKRRIEVSGRIDERSASTASPTTGGDSNYALRRQALRGSPSDSTHGGRDRGDGRRARRSSDASCGGSWRVSRSRGRPGAGACFSFALPDREVE
ncbi:MAG: histidine kinase dimerization/phospho-acceptor domain-containing protein [Myxococcota bacterium]